MSLWVSVGRYASRYHSIYEAAYTSTEGFPLSNGFVPSMLDIFIIKRLFIPSLRWCDCGKERERERASEK